MGDLLLTAADRRLVVVDSRRESDAYLSRNVGGDEEAGVGVPVEVNTRARNVKTNTLTTIQSCAALVLLISAVDVAVSVLRPAGIAVTYVGYNKITSEVACLASGWKV